MQAARLLQCAVSATWSRLIVLTTETEQVGQEEAGVKLYESVHLLDVVDSALLLFVRPVKDSGDKTQRASAGLD